jgi:hypothetical protein
MVDVTQIPLNVTIYESVLKTLREPLAIHFSESEHENPFENAAIKKNTKDQEIYYD